MRSFRFEPVAWMTAALAALTVAETINEATHLLPAAWSPYLLGAIAVLTAVLGKLARDKVTALAKPQDDAGTPLVPKWAAGDSAAPPASGGIGGAGLHSW